MREFCEGVGRCIGFQAGRCIFEGYGRGGGDRIAV